MSAVRLTLYVFLCFCWCIYSLKVKISESTSIEFYKPELIANTEWPDKFVKIESNYIAGDLGDATFTAVNNQNSAKWNQVGIT